jgi:hypothetical protein
MFIVPYVPGIYIKYSRSYLSNMQCPETSGSRPIRLASHGHTGAHRAEEPPVIHIHISTDERKVASWLQPALTRLGKTHRSHTFRESDWLPQLQESDVVIVRVDVEIPMSDDGRDGTHDGRRIRRLVLVMIAEKHSDLGAF